METTKTIQMIPIEHLSSHPQNPRGDAQCGAQPGGAWAGDSAESEAGK